MVIRDRAKRSGGGQMAKLFLAGRKKIRALASAPIQKIFCTE
jgi:hypothetical protein